MGLGSACAGGRRCGTVHQWPPAIRPSWHRECCWSCPTNGRGRCCGPRSGRVGYDALGAPGLGGALRYRPDAPGRGPCDWSSWINPPWEQRRRMRSSRPCSAAIPARCPSCCPGQPRHPCPVRRNSIAGVGSSGDRPALRRSWRRSRRFCRCRRTRLTPWIEGRRDQPCDQRHASSAATAAGTPNTSRKTGASSASV